MYLRAIQLFFLQNNAIKSVRNYNFKYNLSWQSNDTNITDQQLFTKSTFALTEIIKRLKVRTIFSDNHGTYSFEIDLIMANDSFTEQRHRLFGRCYTYHPEYKFRELGIYYMNMEL